MAYRQPDPLKNLDSANNQKKKTRSEHLKDYAAYMTKKGMKPYEYEFSEYLSDQKAKEVDTIYYKDLTGQYHQRITKGGKKVSEKKVDTDYAKKGIAKRIARIKGGM